MEKNTKKIAVKGGIVAISLAAVVGGAAYLGKHYKLVNPFVRITNEQEDNTNRLNLPSWKKGTPYNYTNAGSMEEVKETVVTESEEVKEDETVEESIARKKEEVSTAYTEVEPIYSLTEEELLSYFPDIVTDNSNHVLSSSSVVISENPEQHVISMTSSISGGELIKTEESTTYQEVHPTR